jgi:hypothetical protein
MATACFFSKAMSFLSGKKSGLVFVVGRCVFTGGFAKVCVLNVVFFVVNRGEMRGKCGQKTVVKTRLKLRHNFEVYFAGLLLRCDPFAHNRAAPQPEA